MHELTEKQQNALNDAFGEFRDRIPILDRINREWLEEKAEEIMQQAMHGFCRDDFLQILGTGQAVEKTLEEKIENALRGETWQSYDLGKTTLTELAQIAKKHYELQSQETVER